MSVIHYSFPSTIQMNRYSSLVFWTIFPLIGMVITIYYNKKIIDNRGFETHLSRVLKIIWVVFNISWLIIVFNSSQYFTCSKGIVSTGAPVIIKTS